MDGWWKPCPGCSREQYCLEFAPVDGLWGGIGSLWLQVAVLLELGSRLVSEVACGERSTIATN